MRFNVFYFHDYNTLICDSYLTELSSSDGFFLVGMNFIHCSVCEVFCVLRDLRVLYCVVRVPPHPPS